MLFSILFYFIDLRFNRKKIPVKVKIKLSKLYTHKYTHLVAHTSKHKNDSITMIYNLIQFSMID